MLQDCHPFESALLEVVFNDIETFESIAAKLSQQSTASSGTVDIRSVQCLLLLLIADDFVGAYLLHAEPPFVTAVEVNSDTIQRYWFRITGRGIRRLQNLRRKHDHVHFLRSA